MNKIMNFDEINDLAKKISEDLKEGDVLALIGELGTGKTSFVKEVCKNLNIKEKVKSPTFNYISEYLTGDKNVYHFDVYRIYNPEEIYDIGYEDYIGSNGIVFIEWANLIEDELPNDTLYIEFTYVSDTERQVNIYTKKDGVKKDVDIWNN